MALITAGPLVKAVTNYKQVSMRGTFLLSSICTVHLEQISNIINRIQSSFGKVSRTLEEFDVKECPSSFLEEKFPSLSVIHSAVKSLDAQSHASLFCR